MKPILFSTPMVQAILDGRKTMTRRVIKPQTVTHNGPNGQTTESIDDFMTRNLKDAKLLCLACAPYQPDDVLWVRETWQQDPTGFDEIPPEDWWIYKATDELPDTCTKWRPSIFMPREAARIFLRVTDVRVERVWDITEEDAKAEGLYPGYQVSETSSRAGTAKQAFMWIWQKINGNERWLSNPWVWVYEFEKITKEQAVGIDGTVARVN